VRARTVIEEAQRKIQAQAVATVTIIGNSHGALLLQLVAGASCSCIVLGGKSQKRSSQELGGKSQIVRRIARDKRVRKFADSEQTR
jgi:hypothetical protein